MGVERPQIRLLKQRDRTRKASAPGVKSIQKIRSLVSDFLVQLLFFLWNLHRWSLKLSPQFCQKGRFLLLKGVMSVIWQEQPHRSRLYTSGTSGRAPKLPVFGRSAFFVRLVPLTFQYKELAEFIFRSRFKACVRWKFGNIARKQWRQRFTWPLVCIAVRHSAINTWRQPVSHLRVIDTNLREIARGRGSSLRINHFPLPPPPPPLAEMANPWTSITLPKIKISLSFLDIPLRTLLAIGWPNMNWFGAKRNSRHYYLMPKVAISGFFFSNTCHFPAVSIQVFSHPKSIFFHYRFLFLSILSS